MCVESGERNYGVVRGGNVTVTCMVAANPDVTNFRWWFHSAGDAQEVRANEVNSGGSKSTVTYS